MTKFYKIQVFVPKNHAEAVRLAIGETHADKIGNYDYCCSVTESVGYFRPLPGSNPTIGKIGRIEKVDEVKIEFMCEKSKVKEVITAIKKTHPYEEIAFDIIPMANIEEF